MPDRKNENLPSSQPPEKHPLEKAPVVPEEQKISTEDIDQIFDEEEEDNAPPYEDPAPGEGP